MHNKYHLMWTSLRWTYSKYKKLEPCRRLGDLVPEERDDADVE